MGWRGRGSEEMGLLEIVEGYAESFTATEVVEEGVVGLVRLGFVHLS